MNMAVETWGITRVVKDKKEVENLYLRVPWGKSCCLLGPAGAGKTTVLKILLGLKKVTKGGGLCLGFDLTNAPLSIRERTGLVEEVPCFYGHLKVRELTSFCRSFYPRWNEPFLREKLKEAKVDEETRAGNLSYSHQRLLTLLLALAPEPELLLIDEPGFTYDTPERELFADLIKSQIIHENRTVILSSRYPGKLESMVDRVHLLYQGKLIDSRSPGEILAGVRCIRVEFAGEPSTGADILNLPGIINIRREKEHYIFTVNKNFDEIWDACEQSSYSSLEEAAPELEDFLLPYLEGKEVD